jgi:uncharacterized protein involved in exopolysaccharide biosynthesis
MRQKISSRPEFEDGTSGALPIPLNAANRSLDRLQLLWNGRTKLKHAAIAGLVLGTMVAFLLPARYESTAQLMPPDAQSGAGMAMLAALSGRSGGALENLSGGLLGIKSSGALFVGILGSRTIQERLVKKFNLQKVYRRSIEQDACRELAQNTKAWEDRHSGIITITVTDHDQLRAAAIAEAYVDELNRVVAQLSTSAARRERIFLEQRLVAVKHDLDDASERFSQFSSQNAAIDIKEQGRAMIDVAAALRGQLVAAQSELSGLEQIYSQNNFRVKSVEARSAELEKKLRELGGNQGKAGSQAALDSNSVYPSLRSLPLLGVPYADLYRQSKIQEALYETLTAEYEMAKVQEAKETPSVKVLDVPDVPQRRSFPPRLQIVSLAVAVAIVARTASIFACALWDALHEADPRKAFAREVMYSVSARWTAMQPSNAKISAAINRVCARFGRPSAPHSPTVTPDPARDMQSI